MQSNTKLWVALIVVGIIAIIELFTPVGKAIFAGVTNYDILDTTDGYRVDGTTVIDGTGNLAIGTSGTSIDKIITGTCNLLPDATTIAASSTARVTCQAGTDTTGLTAISGITSGDVILGTLSTTTATLTSNGLVVIGITASNTAGYIETSISNLTGGTYTWPTTGSASGTLNYIVTDQ